MKEIRKEIKDHPEYEISNYGYVVSKSRPMWNGKTWYNSTEKILKITDRTQGIELNGKCYNVINLLAEYFLEYPTDFPKEFYEVYFKDGNKLNRKIDNLYIDISENAMRVYDLEGNYLQDISSPFVFFKNLQEDARSKSGNVYKCAQGFHTKTQGFQFRYLKRHGEINKVKSLPSTLNSRRSDTTPIAKYWNNNLICVYNSITEAAENNELSVEEVWNSRDRNKVIRGFSFKKI